jgi:Mrp family chromosome partitioning ATPase
MWPENTIAEQAAESIGEQAEGQRQASPAAAFEQLSQLARALAHRPTTEPAFAAEPAAVSEVAEPFSEPAAETTVETPTSPVSEPAAVGDWVIPSLGRLFAAFDPNCPLAYQKQFQLLRTQLLLHRARAGSEGFKSVAVLSSLAGEGKTFTARNLAATLAQAAGHNVLLIETRAHYHPHLPEAPGLALTLETPIQWQAHVKRVAGTSLHLLTPGRLPQVTGLDAEPFPHLLNELRPHFEWIIVDGPAFQEAPEAGWLAATCNGTLLVVREGKPLFGDVQEALLRIPAEGLVGVVMNERSVEKKSWLPKVRLRFGPR